MKNYGASKATEFTKKQINVVYRLAKLGEISVEKWVISRFYNLADYYGYDDNGSIVREEQRILRILDKIFTDDLESAQEEIDFYTESVFTGFTTKGQKGLDRSLLN